VIDDTRVRFLKAIAAQLDAERIAEVHLFAAIRQGGMESGVAVLALEPVRELAAVAATETSVASEAGVPPIDETAQAVVTEDVESPYAEPDALHDDAPADDDDEEGDVEAEEVVAESHPAPRRFTVYTARYRHTLKGPDRGKWEVSVTEEADAPLLTVDAVVRGVQRRSGEVEEIVRMTGAEVVALSRPHPVGGSE
jgi:hypothetical protein